MSTTSPGDAFALKNSSLNTFLFAEVGTEQNGSSLTVLSTLARLGKDPWVQAAEWTRLPPAAMIAGLTQSIVQMPLGPRALAEAGATAKRLVLLLPQQTEKTGQTARHVLNELKLPAWLPMAAFCVIMGLSIVVGTFGAAPSTQAPVAQSVPLGQ
jgi:hypothetical protein